MLKDDLLDFGLDQKESRLYLALLELGEASVLQIAQKSGLRRTSVYHLLDSLKGRGLVGTITKQRKRHYFAQNPKKLESELEEKKITLKKMMPELMSLANLIDRKPKIQYFEGIGGIKSVLDNELNSNSTEFFGWCTENYQEVLGEDYFVNYFIPKRKEKKIFFRYIYPITEHFKFLQTLEVKNFWKVKLMDFSEFNVETDIVLYGKTKISLISYTEKIAMIIESPRIFNTLKAIFEAQWMAIPENHNTDTEFQS